MTHAIDLQRAATNKQRRARIADLPTSLAAVYDDTQADWRDRSACNDPNIDTDIFFPERGRSLAAARAICETCTVNPECLEFAVTTSQFGVWAGTSERDRREMRRRRRAEEAAAAAAAAEAGEDEEAVVEVRVEVA